MSVRMKWQSRNWKPLLLVRSLVFKRCALAQAPVCVRAPANEASPDVEGCAPTQHEVSLDLGQGKLEENKARDCAETLVTRGWPRSPPPPENNQRSGMFSSDDAGFLTLDPGVSDKAASGGRVRLPPHLHQHNDASGATGRPDTQGRDSRSRCYCVPEAKAEKNGLSQRPGEELRKRT